MNGYFVVGLLAMWVFIAVGCGSGPSERVEKAKGDADKLVGRLKWTITETATGRILGAGERDVRIADATVRTISDPQFGDLQQLKVPLGDHFAMGLAQGSDATSGFGVTADRDDQPTFCWEWFVVSGKTASKLQESGEIAVQIEGTKLVRADFATDVSLRVIPMAKSADPRNPVWRVEIAKGSFLSWPRWADARPPSAGFGGLGSKRLLARVPKKRTQAHPKARIHVTRRSQERLRFGTLTLIACSPAVWGGGIPSALPAAPKSRSQTTAISRVA